MTMASLASQQSTMTKGLCLNLSKSGMHKGNKVAEFSVKDGKLDGPFKKWSDEGKIISDLNYFVGEMEGPQKEYYPSAKSKDRDFIKIKNSKVNSPSGTKMARSP